MLGQGACLNERDVEPFVGQRLPHGVGEDDPEGGVVFNEQDPYLDTEF